MLGDASFCYPPSALPLCFLLQSALPSDIDTHSQTHSDSNTDIDIDIDIYHYQKHKSRRSLAYYPQLQHLHSLKHPAGLPQNRHRKRNTSTSVAWTCGLRSSVRVLLTATVWLIETLLLGCLTMTGTSSPIGTFCSLLLLLSSASFVQRVDAQDEYLEKPCVEAFGNDIAKWPDWVTVCHNNGTCMLYYPYEDDPYPFPYCICDPPFTGMACETIDWGADSAMMASTYAGATAAVFFGIFAIITAVVCCCYVSTRRVDQK